MRVLIVSITMLLSTTFGYSQEGTIILSTGNGISYEVARKNALRYAIEKVYGSFVSSNSLLSNDILQKDEIYTYSTGAVSNVTEISKVEIEGSCSVTLEVLISTEKLVAFIKNEGQDIKYDAKGFASHIKAFALSEKIAEESEKNIIKSMINFADVVFKNSLDYKIKTSEPLKNTYWGWSVDLDLSLISNKNIDQLKSHIYKTLKALDYSYTYKLKTDKGFTLSFFTNCAYVNDFIEGSPAESAGLRDANKVISYSIGDISRLNKINKKTNKENVTKEIDNAYQNNTPIYLKVDVLGNKKIIEIKPSKYTIRVKRDNMNERWQKIERTVYPITFNGNYFLLRSDESRNALFDFFSKKLWEHINLYKIMVILENSSKEITIPPIYFEGAWRGGNKVKNEGFTNEYISTNSLRLKEFSGISIDEKTINESFNKKIIDFYYFNALFNCKLVYSGYNNQNLETTLDFISSIKEFKVIKP